MQYGKQYTTGSIILKRNKFTGIHHQQIQKRNNQNERIELRVGPYYDFSTKKAIFGPF
jgi:hypothetical protein